MRLIAFLFRKNSRKTCWVMFLGLLSGCASAAIVAVANKALYMSGLPERRRWLLASIFVGVVFAKVSTSLASGLVLGRSLQDIILTLCDALCRNVAATPLRKLETLREHRIMACLTDDISVLSAALQGIPAFVVNLAVILGCTVYLAWTSLASALILMGLVVAIAVIYKLLMSRAFVAILAARDGRDNLFRHFRSLVEGLKELKLHQPRREAFFRQDLGDANFQLRYHNIEAMKRYAVADGWSQSTFYTLLGVMLFVLPQVSQIDTKSLTAYAFVALYMMAPVWGLIGAVPNFNRGRASLAKLEQLGLELAEINDFVPCSPSHPGFAASQSELQPLDSKVKAPLVEFKNVMFSYSGAENGGFTLGPLTLAFHPSELVFIIGGNGSGKSTLGKLLTGLYAPDSGEICVDGLPLAAQDPEQYRQLFSAVFSDFYLFDRLLGIDASKRTSENARKYLAALDLAHKVELRGSSFSTTSLSQGQRRRLALLTAYLEDRPIYVLDEWAADQDPAFRQIFYLRLLPELRSRGKTVVVITHDDRYFHLGDRVIKLEYGKATEQINVAPTTAPLQT